MSFDSGHALVIGVGSYAHMPQADIPISVADAVAVRNLLRDPAFCGYPPDQVTLLHDGQASQAGILSALDGLAQATDCRSTVLLYYCGHGDYDTDEVYTLTTHDTRLSGSKIERGTGIREAELLDKLRKIRATRLLFLFNACHSGEVSPALGLEAADPAFGSHTLPVNSAEAILSSGQARILITACRPKQKSWIGGGQLSIFTQALVNGFRGQGLVGSNAGYVSAFALYEHTYLAVREAAQKLGHVQEPELSVLKGVGPFPVALYQGASPQGAFDTDEPLPKDSAVRAVDPLRSERHFRQIISTLVVADEGGVAVGGSVQDSTVVAGDGNVIDSRRTEAQTEDGDAIVIGDVSDHGAVAAGEGAKATNIHVEGDVNLLSFLAQLLPKRRARRKDRDTQE